MTCYQRGHGRRQLLRAMQQLGGRVMEVYREESDPNGMPTGAKTTVCKLYGLRYQQHATTLTLGLDMPGVITITLPSSVHAFLHLFFNPL